MDARGAEPGRNVVLTGFMGTGKTTVGRLVAGRLGYDFVDTDVLIEARHGPIPVIFRDAGEDAFRRMERAVARELSTRTGLVIATGGRMMVDPDSAAQLGSTGDVVCLAASVDTIVARTTGGAAPADRPMLAAEDGDVRARIVELLAERAEAYGRFRQIDTDGRTPDQVAAAIVAAVGGT